MDIPNTSEWQPRINEDTLKMAFVKRCQHIEEIILHRSKNEREMNLDNYDSGVGVEDIIKEEFQKLFPQRYTITSGVIDDSKCQTAGDFDIIFANTTWFPALKYGATEKSRRFHYPIESIYAVLEVKQTLTIKSFDEAMKKLVTCNRLYRSELPTDRITENRIAPFKYVPSLQLYSGIIATDIGEDVTIEKLLHRFFQISRTLKCDELVRNICILGKGGLSWGYLKNTNELSTPLFKRDFDQPIFPVFYGFNESGIPSMYEIVSDLMAHLNNTVLRSEDIHMNYGMRQSPASYDTDFIINNN